jgi:DmsE family decaheme c-type cytochrome
MEAGGDATLIRRFRDYKAADFCTTCHRESTRHASFTTGMHANRAAVNCLSCHSIHSSHPRGAHLNVKPTQELCAGCHPTQDATIRQKPFTHRPIVGVMDCASCHDPHGRPGQESLRLTRTGEPPCLSCHSEKRGPFVFEHPTGQSVSSAADCYRCHETHGSSNPKMLVRGRVFQLCLECHSPISPNTLGSQPPSFHNISLPRYRNCTTCHVAIHGSNVSPTLFK